MPSNDGVPVVPRSFRVLVIGGSYGGLAAALNLSDLSRGRRARFDSNPNSTLPSHRIPIQITVVDERDGYYHLIGSPKSLACEKFALESWTRFRDIPALNSPDFTFIQGSVSEVNCRSKVAHILETNTKETRVEPYDYLIASSGLRRVFPTVPGSLQRTEFLREVKHHIADMRRAQEEGVAVVGGGAVGVEMAAELKELDPQRKVTLIHSRDRLLSSEPLPDDFAERVYSILREDGIEVILGQRVVDTTAVNRAGESRAWCLTLGDGRQIMTGHVLNAISRCVPTSTYLPSKALDEAGYVRIHSTAQFAGDIPNGGYHFGVGDLTAWPGIKRCGGAMHMGHYAAVNIHQHMMAECGGGKLTFITLQPFPSTMGLALGKTAVAYTPSDGTRHGVKLMESMFGEDMGNTICWNYMRLGEECQA
ncbi:uncharacterized protein N7459_007763 [Penicillium hispanicum]|uniref:uncharacterized protein n=1 Tax=Penicillium hispanicum TaxID=1080232 RepID=UPI00254097DB|nr:uncharacterized protein N7459_007763 [Penicillium hispanicum]KAJ5578799.1 hypothetical protein N7459_007763 [Penicillium hispanicum]